MINLAAFLPQDTRSTELVSSFALICFCLACLSALSINLISFDASGLLIYHAIPFWALITGVLGGIQLYAVSIHPKAELLRVIVSWVNGSFWVWLSLISTPNNIDPGDIGTFFLGIVNLYAFCINALLVRKTWES